MYKKNQHQKRNNPPRFNQNIPKNNVSLEKQCPQSLNCQKHLQNNCKFIHLPNDKQDIESLNRIKKNKAIVISDTYYKDIHPICLFEMFLSIKLVGQIGKNIEIGKYYQGQFVKIQGRAVYIEIIKCIASFGDWKVQREIVKKYEKPIYRQSIAPLNKKLKIGLIKINGSLNKVLHGQNELRTYFQRVNEKDKYPLLNGCEIRYLQIPDSKKVQIYQIKYPNYLKLSGILQIDSNSQFYFIPRCQTYDQMNPYKIPVELNNKISQLINIIPYSILKKQKIKAENQNKINKLLQVYLVKGQFQQWPIWSRYPIIHLKNQIQEKNFHSEKDGIIYEAGISPNPFTKKQRKQCQNLVKAFKIKNFVEKRKTLKGKIFTVDSKNTKCHDDALYIDQLQNNQFNVEIHISDVAELIKAQSSLDNQIKKRDQSLYIKDYYQPMIVEPLRSLLSLKQGSQKLTLSLIFKVNNQGFIDFSSVRYKKTIIQIQKNFSYQKLQKELQNFSSLFKLSQCISKSPLFKQSSLIQYDMKSQFSMSRIIQISGLIPTIMLQINILRSRGFKKKFDEFIKNIIKQKQIQMQDWQNQVEKINLIKKQLKLNQKQQKDLKNIIKKELMKEKQKILKKIKEEEKEKKQLLKKEKKEKKEKLMNGKKQNKLSSEQEFQVQESQNEFEEQQIQQDIKSISNSIQNNQIQLVNDQKELKLKQKRAKAIKQIKKDQFFDNSQTQSYSEQQSSDQQLDNIQEFKINAAKRGKNYLTKIFSHFFKEQINWAKIRYINEAFQYILKLDKRKLYQQYFIRMQIMNRQHFPYIVNMQIKQLKQKNPSYDQQKSKKYKYKDKKQKQNNKIKQNQNQIKEKITQKKQIILKQTIIQENNEIYKKETIYRIIKKQKLQTKGKRQNKRKANEISLNIQKKQKILQQKLLDKQEIIECQKFQASQQSNMDNIKLDKQQSKNEPSNKERKLNKTILQQMKKYSQEQRNIILDLEQKMAKSKQQIYQQYKKYFENKQKIKVFISQQQEKIIQSKSKSFQHYFNYAKRRCIMRYYKIMERQINKKMKVQNKNTQQQFENLQKQEQNGIISTKKYQKKEQQNEKKQLLNQIQYVKKDQNNIESSISKIKLQNNYKNINKNQQFLNNSQYKSQKQQNLQKKNRRRQNKQKKKQEKKQNTQIKRNKNRKRQKQNEKLKKIQYQQQKNKSNSQEQKLIIENLQKKMQQCKQQIYQQYREILQKKQELIIINTQQQMENISQKSKEFQQYYNSVKRKLIIKFNFYMQRLAKKNKKQKQEKNINQDQIKQVQQKQQIKDLQQLIQIQIKNQPNSEQEQSQITKTIKINQLKLQKNEIINILDKNNDIVSIQKLQIKQFKQVSQSTNQVKIKELIINNAKNSSKKSKKQINKMILELMKPITQQIKLKYKQKIDKIEQNLRDSKSKYTQILKKLKQQLQKSELHFNLIRLLAINNQQKQIDQQNQNSDSDQQNNSKIKRKIDNKKKNKKNKKIKKQKKVNIFEQFLDNFYSYADKAEFKFHIMKEQQIDQYLKKELDFKQINEDIQNNSIQQINKKAYQIASKNMILKWNNPIRNYESLMIQRLIKKYFWLFQGNIFPTQIIQYFNQIKLVEDQLTKIKNYKEQKIANGQTNSKVKQANRQISKLQFYYKLKKNPNQIFTFLNVTSPTPKVKRVFHEILGQLDLENCKFQQKLYQQVKGKVKIIRDFPIKFQVQIIK